MEEHPKLIIIGDGETAEIAYEYFTYDSPYEVTAFSVETAYLKKKQLFGLPVVPLEELEHIYDRKTHRAFVAVSYAQLNRVRQHLYREVKNKGFSLVWSLSSKAFVWRNAEIGENCFVSENNDIQYHVTIGNNVILWGSVMVGHRTAIRNNVFVGSHAVISGYCEIGENCFLGSASCISDNLKVAKDCVIGAGAVVIRNTEQGKVYVGNPAKPTKRSSYATFGVKEV